MPFSTDDNDLWDLTFISAHGCMCNYVVGRTYRFHLQRRLLDCAIVLIVEQLEQAVACHAQKRALHGVWMKRAYSWRGRLLKSISVAVSYGGTILGNELMQWSVSADADSKT